MMHSEARQQYRSALIAGKVPDKTADKFLDWHAKHPDVWRAFKKMTLALIDAGKKSYGAKAIMEVIRFNHDIQGGKEFKISNNYTAYYARIFAIQHPSHQNFFQFKAVKGLKNTTTTRKDHD